MSKWRKRIEILEKEIQLLTELEKLEKDNIEINDEILNSDLLNSLKACFSKKEKRDKKFISLSDMIVSVGKTTESKPITLKQLSEQVIQNGYVSKSANFENIVYQAVTKLVTSGQFKSVGDKTYQFIDE